MRGHLGGGRGKASCFGAGESSTAPALPVPTCHSDVVLDWRFFGRRVVAWHWLGPPAPRRSADAGPGNRCGRLGVAPCRRQKILFAKSKELLSVELLDHAETPDFAIANPWGLHPSLILKSYLLYIVLPTNAAMCRLLLSSQNHLVQTA